MYVMGARKPEGLGLAPWIVPLLVSIGGTAGGAFATRLIAGPSSPSQKDLEEQIRLQHRLEIQRQMQAAAIQRQQTAQLGSYLMPALGVAALVMLLR